MTLQAATVAGLLTHPATRRTALGALERHAGPHDRALALAAAPPLGALLAADEADVDEAMARRLGLLLARMCADAPDDPATILGAAFAERGLTAMLGATSSAFARALATPAAELTREHALTFACAYGAWYATGEVRGHAAIYAAMGYTTALEALQAYMGSHPMVSKKRMPSDDIPLRMSELVHEMLRSPETLPEFAAAGAFVALKDLVTGRPEVAKQLVQAGIFETLATYLRPMGSVAEWSVRPAPCPFMMPEPFSSACGWYLIAP